MSVSLVAEQRYPKQEYKFKGFWEVPFGSANLTPCACTMSAKVVFYISFSVFVCFVGFVVVVFHATCYGFSLNEVLRV